MLVATMFPAQATATGVQSPSRKLLQASREFEGLLLDMLVSPMEKTFSSLPGQKDVPGDSEYAHMATQGLASALAVGGGLGIADMIMRNVMRDQGVTRGRLVKGFS